jgi:hypothetical protein
VIQVGNIVTYCRWFLSLAGGLSFDLDGDDHHLERLRKLILNQSS